MSSPALAAWEAPRVIATVETSAAVTCQPRPASQIASAPSPQHAAPRRPRLGFPLVPPL